MRTQGRTWNTTSPRSPSAPQASEGNAGAGADADVAFPVVGEAVAVALRLEDDGATVRLVALGKTVPEATELVVMVEVCVRLCEGVEIGAAVLLDLPELGETGVECTVVDKRGLVRAELVLLRRIEDDVREETCRLDEDEVVGDRVPYAGMGSS